MRVIQLAGTPREIGERHGEALAAEIRDRVSQRRAHGAPIDPAGFVDAARERAPALVDEIEGIADGAGIALDDAWLLQVGEETSRALGRADADRSTSFAVVHGMRSWSGQVREVDGPVVVLHVRPPDGASLRVVTTPGCVGLFGLSAARYAVWSDPLAQVPFATTGLPVALVTRSALARPSFAAAVDAVRDAPHATGQHYLVVGSESIASYECSPAGVVPVMPGTARTWHTNHPLVGSVPEPEDAESDARWEAVRPLMQLPSWGRVRSRELLALVGDGSTIAAFAEQTTRTTDLWIDDVQVVSDTT